MGYRKVGERNMLKLLFQKFFGRKKQSIADEVRYYRSLAAYNN